MSQIEASLLHLNKHGKHANYFPRNQPDSFYLQFVDTIFLSNGDAILWGFLEIGDKRKYFRLICGIIHFLKIPTVPAQI